MNPSTDTTELDLDGGLKALGYESFRRGQREAIEEIIRTGNLLLVAPTGGGKSLTYQLPASLLSGTTLVISPLIALMKDQVQALDAIGLPATYLASTLDDKQMRERTARLEQGQYKLVYIAPERLTFAGFRQVLSQLDCPLLAVDEAHCISEWGHDFRPVYRNIGNLLEEMRPPRVLACTATATPIVRDEIVMRLGMPADTPQRIHGFARPNLTLRAFETVTKRDRTKRVDAALDEAIGKPSSPQGAAIIYTATRRAAEQEADRLQEIGWNAVCYHAGLSPAQRTTSQEAFSSGEAEIVAATNAFGMGIDRADVRTVIHLSPPGSVEAYYQEVGRAGRDGQPSWGMLLTSTQDLPLRRRLLEMEIEGREPDPAVVEHKWGLFLELMRWAEGGSCRHDAILRYFGDEAETLQGCGRCDVCRNVEELPAADSEEVNLIVRKALSGLARVHRKLGLIAAANLLKGKNDEKLIRYGLQDVRTFGLLKDKKHEWIVRLLRRCVTAGWVAFSGDERPVVVLTENGRQVMMGKRPGRLLLPSEATTAKAGAGRAGEEKKAVGELDALGASIFEALRAWRLIRSRSEKIPPYVVASDRCLRDIALLRPKTTDELMLANGIGPARAERFGNAILEVVSQNAS